MLGFEPRPLSHSGVTLLDRLDRSHPERRVLLSWQSVVCVAPFISEWGMGVDAWATLKQRYNAAL